MEAGRGLWRRLALGAAALAGRRAGFFIPYRHAGQSLPPPRYIALDRYFMDAAPLFQSGVGAIARHLETLLTFGGLPPQPRFEQDWFPRLDAAIAYAYVRERRPSRIVEIGSGHSTRFLARAIADGGLPTRLTAIDPAPRATLDGLPISWCRTTLQGADTALFADLDRGDMLIVDSSHILMPGTDVDLVLNSIVPGLKPGVLVHFHDIFLPETYPDEWSWRGYNEQNAVASLMHSGGWRLLWSSRWVATRMAADLEQAGLNRLPLMRGAHESSLWLEKR